jgi:glycosyltransferase involved in cell wall biosynthesis
VATHVMTSAAALARHGVRVSVAAARIEHGEPVPGVELIEAPLMFDERADPAARLGGALASAPTAAHLHQFDDPEIVAAIRETTPAVISSHGYSACTSGVHYFRPGSECMRAHGPGCIPRLPACAHTSDPRGLPASYRKASRSLAALRLADLALSYSSVVDRHLAINGIARRGVIPLFTTMAPAVGSGHAGRRRVVFAGRLVLPKGIAVLIRAARRVDAEFVVCGDGWRLEQMRRLAQKLGVAERVEFRGWLSSEALAVELAEASLVAMPSLWPEPFGLIGIETFAAGRPVVASATGGVGDWLQDGVSGLTVKAGDERELATAIERLLDDPDRQAQMGAAGRQTVAERFSEERHVAALLEAYGTARASWESAGGGRRTDVPVGPSPSAKPD